MTNIESQLIDAATMMATGMSVVFVFLTILVCLVRLMSKFVGPSEEEQCLEFVHQPSPVSPYAQNKTISPQITAVISAAIHQHHAKVIAK